MDPSAFRWKRHAANAVAVFVALAAFQYWQGRFDPVFVAIASSLYLVIALGVEAARDRLSER